MSILGENPLPQESDSKSTASAQSLSPGVDLDLRR